MTATGATILIVGAVQTLGLGVVAWVLFRAMAVLRDVYFEAQMAKAERIRRQQSDELEIWEAKTIVGLMRTAKECDPCRDRIERETAILRDRYKLWPQQPQSLTTYAKPTKHAGQS